MRPLGEVLSAQPARCTMVFGPGRGEAFRGPYLPIVLHTK